MIIHLGKVGGGGGGDIDIIDNLNSTRSDAALSAKQGKILKEMQQTELAKKADKDGVIAFAKDIVSREDGIGAQFIRRRSAGQLHIGDGSAFMRSIHGKSIVWNQLVPNGDFAEGASGWSATRSTISVSDGIITATCTGQDSWGFNYFSPALVKTPVVGHKYLMSFAASVDETSQIYFAYGANTKYFEISAGWQRYSQIITATSGTGNYFEIQMVGAPVVGDTMQFKTISCIDLTQMFGAGYEPSTAAEFEALYSKSYYPYNAGKIINLKATKLLTNGFNQWDEQWELGKYVWSTGEKTASSTAIRSKNPISVIGGQTYYFHHPVIADKYWAYAIYDAEMRYIGGNNNTYAATITMPSNARYLNISTYDGYGPTYNQDICINFSNASLNGQYKPYEEHELTLPAGITKTYTGADGQTHTWQGLDSAGSAYDEQTPTKNIQRIGVVDMGSLNWTYSSATERFASSYIQEAVSSTSEFHQDIICAAYSPNIVAKFDSDRTDKVIALYQGLLLVRDSSYTDGELLKASLAGVLLLYPLADPIETEFPARNFNYFVNDMGQEWILPEGVDEQGVTLTAPFNAVIAYASNIRDTTFHLPENYLSHESTIALLEAMKSANIIASYTMTFDTATNKYNFTITKA